MEMEEVSVSNVSAIETVTSNVKTESIWDNKFSALVSLYMFLIIGLDDGASGAVLISAKHYYDVSYATISLVFLCQIFGYGLMSLFSSFLMAKLGRWKFAMIGTCCLVSFHALVCWGPKKFEVVIFACFIEGLGSGSYEGPINSYIGSFRESGYALGILNGFYGLGTALSPIIATQMISHGIAWYRYYFVLLGNSSVCLILVCLAFRPRRVAIIDDANYGNDMNDEVEYVAGNTDALFVDPSNKVLLDAVEEVQEVSQIEIMKRVLTNRLCLVCGLFTALDLGLSLSVGGWVTSYLVKARGGEESAMGWVCSGFWFGFTAGRFFLPWPASKIGIWNACLVCILMATIFEVVFWKALHLYTSAVSVAFLGFFIGPFFPLVIQLATEELDPLFHVAGISFISAFGSVGGALLPFLVGVAATKAGVAVVPYILTGLLGSLLVVWLFVPRPRSSGKISS